MHEGQPGDPEPHRSRRNPLEGHRQPQAQCVRAAADALAEREAAALACHAGGRDGEVDEDDAALQHAPAEQHVRGGDDQVRQQRRAEQEKIEGPSLLPS